MKKTFIFLILFIFITLSSCSLFASTSVVDEIALRFKVTPSWSAIREQLILEFKPGMTREDIHKVLDKVGPWIMDLADSPDQGGMDSNTKQLLFRENIHFTQGETLRVLGYWGFLYSENGKLVRTENFDIP